MKDYLVDSLALIGIGAAVGVVMIGVLAAFGHLNFADPLFP